MADGADHATTYEVIAVRFGELKTRASNVFLNWFHYGEADRDVVLNYYFWIVRNHRHVVVVDTGFDREVGAGRGRTTLVDPADALAMLEIDPGEVQVVVITHGHYDHTGNIGLFPNARFILSEREFTFLQDPVSRRGHLGHPVQWDDVDLLTQLYRIGRVELIPKRFRLSAGLQLIDVGGHTPGQLIAVIRGRHGDVVLAADALHLYEEIEKDRPFAICADLPGMYRAFDTLRTFDRAVLVAGHDPDVMRRFPPVFADRPGVAVRLD